MVNKHRKFMEDDFDLDNFRKEQTYKTVKEKSDHQNKRLIGIIRILIFVAAFITAFELYSYASYLIEVWRENMINETAHNVARQAAFAEGAAMPEAVKPSAVREARDRVILTSTPVLMPAIADLRNTFSNDDIVGYLNIDGSNIDFPIAQAGDNSYYLTHDLRLQKNAAGSAFMDYDSRIYPMGYNTVIYAHNMRDGSMFHNLRYYNDPVYFNAHKTISLQTLYEDTLWEIFSFYESNVEFLYNTTQFYNADEFIAFAKLIEKKSKYPSDLIFTEGTKILTLSTCTNRDADTRFVVHARRI